MKDGEEGDWVPQLVEQHNMSLSCQISGAEYEVIALLQAINPILQHCLTIDPTERPSARELHSRFNAMRVQLQKELSTRDAPHKEANEDIGKGERDSASYNSCLRYEIETFSL